MFPVLFPRCFRSLVVAWLAVGMIFSGVSLPLLAAAAASGTASPPTSCCCGSDGNCGMGCCAMQSPAVPEMPVPTAPLKERSAGFSVVISQAGLLHLQPKPIARAQHSLRVADLSVENSLQSLQVRLDI